MNELLKTILENQQFQYLISFIAIVVLAYFIYFEIKKISLMRIKNKNKKENENEIKNINLNVKEADELINFLDKIIKTKFNFYFMNEILPMYFANKKPDKTQIKELQEKFYIDVSALLNKNFKKIYKKYFTTQGLEIYINEKFIYYLNKFDSMNSEIINKNDTIIHDILS